MTDVVATDRRLLAMPEPAPPPSRDARDWLRQNLFRSWGDAVLTVVASVVVAIVLYLSARFVFVTGRWDIVRTNLTLFMVGRYPHDELWRVSLSLCCLAAYGGVLAGFVHRRQLAAGRAGPELTMRARVIDIVGRLWPLLLGTLVLLSLSATIGPWLLALGVVAAAVVGRVARRASGPPVAVAGGGRRHRRSDPAHRPADRGGQLERVGRDDAQRLPRRRRHRAVVPTRRAARARETSGPPHRQHRRRRGAHRAAGGAVPPVAAASRLRRRRRGELGPARAHDRARLRRVRRRPALDAADRARCCRWPTSSSSAACPLFVLLLLGAIAIGFFLPVGMDPPGLVVRAIIVFTVFTAAYLAEIVRGGLQSLPAVRPRPPRRSGCHRCA